MILRSTTTSQRRARAFVAPFLSSIVVVATFASLASAAPSRHTLSPRHSPEMLDISNNLVIDSIRPLNRDQERNQQVSLARQMLTADDLASPEGPVSEDSSATEEPDGELPDAEVPVDESDDSEKSEEDVVSAASATEIGPVAETSSGQIRLCFRGDTPQIVRREALAAASQWDAALVIEGPVVEIDFYWLSMSNPNILGAAGPTRFILNPGLPQPEARYPVALANELLGVDQMPRGVCGSVKEGEIVLVLNADAGSNAGGWIAGQEMLDPSLNAGEATDLQTTLLHEFGHGFGFIGSAELNEFGDLAWPNDHATPLVFDLFTRSCERETFQGCATDDSTDVQIGDLDAVTSGKLWISTGLGPLLELEAPFQWDAGSSFSHLDEFRYPAKSRFSLMTPYIDTEQRIRSVDTGTLAIMQMMGWTVAGSVAPITEVTGTAGPNQVSLAIGPTNLADGVPPAAYELQVRRIERNAAGDLTKVPAYQPLSGHTPQVTIEGLANEVLYQIEIAAVGSTKDGPTANSNPLLPMPRSTAGQYVQQMYETFVGRQATGPEQTRFNFLANASDQGLQDATAEVFARDQIFDQQIVARLYLGFLGRSPDLGGLRYWTDRLQGGSPIIKVAEDFAAATTFETELILDDEDFVHQVYVSVLKRDPDAQGLSYWTGLLSQGVSRGRVLIEISESVEHRRATPVLPEMLIAYLRWDDRLPSTDELELWFPSVNGDGMGPLLSALIVDAVPLVDPATEFSGDGEPDDAGDGVGLWALSLSDR